MSVIVSKNKSSVYLETPIKQQPGDKDFLQFKNSSVNVKFNPVAKVLSYGSDNQLVILSTLEPENNAYVHIPTKKEVDVLYMDKDKQIKKKRTRLEASKIMLDIVSKTRIAITFNGSDASYTNNIKSNWKQFTKDGIKGDSARMTGPVTNAGKYAVFNGSNYIQFNNGIDMAKRSFTISAWINMAGNDWPKGGHNVIVGNSDSGTDKALHFAICGNKPNFIRLGFFGDDVDIKTPLQPKESKWRHVVWTHDTNTKLSKLYVDGKFVGSGKHKNQYIGGINQIGCASNYDANTFHGYMRDVLIIDGVQSDEVIEALYNSLNFNVHQVNISNLNLPSKPISIVEPFDAKMLLSTDMDEDIIEPELVPIDFKVNENNELIASSKIGKGDIYVDGKKFTIKQPAKFNDINFKPDPFNDGSCLLNLPLNGTLLDYANKGAYIKYENSVDAKTKFENDSIMGKVTKFNGNKDMVFISMPDKLKVTFSMTTWFKLSDLDHTWCLVGADFARVPKKADGFDWWLRYDVNNGLHTHWGRDDKGEVNRNGFKDIKENEWYFGYFEYSQKQMRAKYFNVKGELVYNFVFNNPADLVQTFSNHFAIGGGWSNAASGNKWDSFKGSIKQFKVFNRALNNNEIQTLLKEKVDPEFKLEIPDLKMDEAPKLIYKVRPKALVPLTNGKPKLGINTELVEDGLVFHGLYSKDLTDRVTGKKMIANAGTITMDLPMGITGHRLNKTSEFVSLPNESAIALSSKVSLSFWIYGDNYNIKSNTLFNLGNQTFELQVSNSTLQLAAGRVNGGWYWVNMIKLEDKKAYHIITTGDFETNIYKVYVNGKKVFDFRTEQTAMVGKRNKIGTVGLMCRLDYTNTYYSVKDIYVSNYRVYNRLLTESEVVLLANEFKTFDPKVDKFMINKPIKNLSEVAIGVETVIPKNNLINSISLKNRQFNKYEVCRVEVKDGKLNVAGNVKATHFSGTINKDATMGEVIAFDRTKKQYLRLSNSPFSLNAIKRNIAIAGWIYVEDPANGGILTNDSGGYNGYGIGVYRNTFWFDIRNVDGKNNSIRDAVIDKISANVPVKGKWYHLAFNYKVDNGNLIIDAYANGFKYRHKELPLDTYYAGKRSSYVFIGGIEPNGDSFVGHENNNGIYTTCKIKEVRYFDNYNLTPDDIEQLMTGYKTELQLGVASLPTIPAINSNTKVLDIEKINTNGQITFADTIMQSRAVQRGLILDKNVKVLPPFTTNMFKLK